jgi:pimeloyl-ACP methyl ester carboxylesterase
LATLRKNTFDDKAEMKVAGNLREERVTTMSGNALAATTGGDPGSPGVVLLHGGGQTRHSWHHTVRSLVSKGYHAVAYDARGHGDSDWDTQADYELSRFAADLRAMVARMRTAPALIGASMGGLTVLHAVGREDPAWASAMVLVDIAPRVNPTGSKRIIEFMTARPEGFKTIDEAADAVAAYNPHRPRPRDSSGLMKNLRLREDGRLHWHWDPRIFGSRDFEQAAAEIGELLQPCGNIKIPSLLVRGQHSDVVTDESIAELKTRLPQLEVATVGGAGHMIAGDRNSAFDCAILPFLDRHFPA